MSEVVEQVGEKTFEYYLDLPLELRAMVIDQMGTEERCRFIRCSYLCYWEAKYSINYLETLMLHCDFDEGIYVYIGFKDDGDENQVKAKIVEFAELDGKKYARCWSTQNVELWREELPDNEEDPKHVLEYALEYFEQLLVNHHNKVKEILFHGKLFQSVLNDYEFGLENWRNIEKLGMDGSLHLLLSKMTRPLKTLIITEGREQEQTNYAEMEQIYQVTSQLILAETKLNYEQMLRLAAPVVLIPIGYMNEEDICRFIRSWQKGTLGKRVEYYEWKNLDQEDFDVEKLFKLLGIEYDGAESKEVEIKHYTTEGLTAKLAYYVDIELKMKFVVNSV